MYRVLLVDDEPMALFSAVHVFRWEQYGFDAPVTFTDPHAALDALVNGSFDAAFVDMRMPGLTGSDIMRSCSEAGKSTLFVVLSGFSEFDYVQSALRLRAFDYCLKPIQPDAAEGVLSRLAEQLYTERLSSDLRAVASLNTASDFARYCKSNGYAVPAGRISPCLVSADGISKHASALSVFSDLPVLWVSENTALCFSQNPSGDLTRCSAQIDGCVSCYLPVCDVNELRVSRTLKLLTDALCGITPGTPPLQLHTSDISPAFFDLLEYVNTHSAEDISLQHLADSYHLNYTYCSELFKTVTGLTFTKYVTSRRMENASKLIAETGKSINDIALECGYSNYNHFCNTFKTIYGTTPGAYRTAIREGSKG